jgi:hypothetical protein
VMYLVRIARNRITLRSEPRLVGTSAGNHLHRQKLTNFITNRFAPPR